MVPLSEAGQPRSVGCGVITASDTRTPETDSSGQLIQDRLTTAGHRVGSYHLVADEPEQIRPLVLSLAQRPDLQVLIITGGTGIAPRDVTYDAIATLITKTLPGFGELFRYLSYLEIGSRAMASRAVAGVCENTLIFSLPGSTKAVRLAMDELILPELRHLTSLLQ
ncbi:Molybdenum cofactor biosynthesis protein B [Halomicronema hongdechloris C2206]|uniref:Molybdenum cofactor biosynthesis protein B n=1 Tax=Halomicronema hongdechloris C2206 TaxID=1641165 RepID=A0A1Z3HN92_9CYAN|nr:MogA/MoaB family molybdenum cofactor biosynthesis protein [Halomicronema hongdechloris]ASC71736.1 Molybdenum cofactor biosynthesis protein B [Halomicronema hongdechloris C2206]